MDVQRARKRGLPRWAPIGGIAVLAVAAVIALVAVLCAGWIPDYRYWGNRSNVTNWPVTSATCS